MIVNAQSLTFKKTAIDAGLTTWYKPLVVKYRFVNESDFPVTIVDVDPGCGCMMPEWNKKPIKPSEEGMVVVTYNAELLGRFNRDILVMTDVSEVPQILKLKCKVVAEEVDPYVDPDDIVVKDTVTNVSKEVKPSLKPEIALSTEFLVIGKHDSAKVLKGIVVIQNKGKDPLTIYQVKSSSPELVVTDVKTVLKPNKKCKVKVMLDPRLIKDSKVIMEFHVESNDPIKPDAVVKVSCY